MTVLVSIYSTLGLAWPPTGYLRYRGLRDGLVVFGLLLVGATILTQGLQIRLRGAEVSVVLGIMAACLLVLIRSLASAEEHPHLIEYGVVDVFIYEALTERTRQGRRVPVPGLLAVIATELVGLLDESICYILPPVSSNTAMSSLMCWTR